MNEISILQTLDKTFNDQSKVSDESDFFQLVRNREEISKLKKSRCALAQGTTSIRKPPTSLSSTKKPQYCPLRLREERTPGLLRNNSLALTGTVLL